MTHQTVAELLAIVDHVDHSDAGKRLP